MTDRPQRCLLCEARLNNPVCQMTAEAADRFSAMSLVTSLRPGQVLFSQGDPAGTLFIIRQGQVRILHEHPDGTQQLLRVAGPGEILGVGHHADQQHSTSAVARSTGSVCSIRLGELERLLESNAELALAWAHLLMDEVQRARDTVSHLSLHPAGVRLARYLAQSLRDGQPSPGSPRTVRLTHAELAGLLSIAQETATRLLRDLEERSILRLSRGQIEVLDVDRLEAVAGFPGSRLSGPDRA